MTQTEKTPNQNSEWLEPQTLIAAIDPLPYPIDAIPKIIRQAIEEVYGFTKAPLPMIASSAIAPLSLAAQAHINVKRTEKLTGPVALFFLTIADSGERKSTCDNFFMEEVKKYEKEQAKLANPLIDEYKAKIEIWEAKKNGLKERIKQDCKSGKPTDEAENALTELETEKPEVPRIPRMLYTDATPEALAYGIKNWPSTGIISAEAGAVLGAHGMNKDSIMRNLAQQNILWDGGSLKYDRRSSESFIVNGGRLTQYLQVQEATLHDFLDRSGKLARGTGYLARFLLSWPKSTQGSRSFSEPPTSWPALSAYNRRIAEILNKPVSFGDNMEFNPVIMTLNDTAKNAWIIFHDTIEKELVNGGELRDIRDVASKAADNAVRLAALFQMFDGDSCVISVDSFESASRIVFWHLNEARRFFSELALPSELVNAVRLNQWLVDYCLQKNTNFITRREIQRCITPNRLRKSELLDRALLELVNALHIRQVTIHRRKEIYLNPKILVTRG